VGQCKQAVSHQAHRVVAEVVHTLVVEEVKQYLFLQVAGSHSLHLTERCEVKIWLLVQTQQEGIIEDNGSSI
jgi:hypothetical protein